MLLPKAMVGLVRSAHTRLVEAVQAVVSVKPAGQVAQAVHVCPSLVVLKVPAGHAAQPLFLVAEQGTLRNCPAGHCVAQTSQSDAVLKSPLNLPGPHAWHTLF